MKSKEDIEFDDKAAEYERVLGERYVLCFDDSRTHEEHMAAMEEAIRTGVPVRIPEHHIPPGVVL